MERRDAVANSRGGIGVKIKDTRGISRNNETERTTQVWRKTEQRNYNRVIKFEHGSR